jgi:alanyl-tRNA synthetase
VGENVNLEINLRRRNDAKAYHSATHLLHEALRRTLGKHVTQKGSLVSPEKLRFDFSHNKPIEKNEINKIEDLVNDMVSKASDVRTRVMTPKEAVDNGALALFGEKYGDEVRVLSMGEEKDKYFSTELCGGTHVSNTSEIGRFKIISQSSISSGVRRVEALRADQLVEYEKNLKQTQSTKENKLNEEITNIKKALEELKIKPNDNNVLSAAENLKNLSKQLDQANLKNIIADKSKNIFKDSKIADFTFRYQTIKNFPSKELRTIIDSGKKDLKKGVLIAFSVLDGKVGVSVGVTKDLTEKFDAVELAKIAATILGGKGGGGRKDFAQAGGVDQTKVEDAYKAVLKKIS